MHFTTADLCDEHGNTLQVLRTPLQSYGAKTSFYGQIVTIKLDQDNRGLVEMLRDEDGKGKVAVVDVSATYCAVVGDNLMGFAANNGWEGIVINGYVRDTKITKTLNSGLFAIGTCPRRSSKRADSIRTELLTFGDVTFRESEWLYGDEDGVVVSVEKLN